MDVAAAAPAALGDHDRDVCFGDLGELLARRGVVDDRADRHAHHQIAPGLAVAVLAHALLPVLGAQRGLVREVVERAEAARGDEHDVAAATSVAAGWAAHGYV